MARVFHQRIKARSKIGTKMRIVPAMAPETTLTHGEEKEEEDEKEKEELESGGRSRWLNAVVFVVVV